MMAYVLECVLGMMTVGVRVGSRPGIGKALMCIFCASTTVRIPVSIQGMNDDANEGWQNLPRMSWARSLEIVKDLTGDCEGFD
jgi:hypothetical protein